MAARKASSPSHFIRRANAPAIRGRDYQVFRPFVREDFRATCAYCLLEERWAAGIENYELDHFRPKSRFPELLRSFHNLYWCCHVCNRMKAGQWPSDEVLATGVGFVDLCAAAFSDHFIEQEDGSWRALTKSAEYTIDKLRLNRPHLLTIRVFLRAWRRPQRQGRAGLR